MLNKPWLRLGMPNFKNILKIILEL
jgi:hypothetical protein